MTANPAASDEVHPAGRAALEFKFQIAPEPDWPGGIWVDQVSYKLPFSVSTDKTCRSLVLLLAQEAPSMSKLVLSGYAPASLSDPYKKLAALRFTKGVGGEV
jgi:hypothetical protein